MIMVPGIGKILFVIIFLLIAGIIGYKLIKKFITPKAIGETT